MKKHVSFDFDMYSWDSIENKFLQSVMKKFVSWGLMKEKVWSLMKECFVFDRCVRSFKFSYLEKYFDGM